MTATRGRLRFVERREYVSIYRRHNGAQVSIPHGWTTRYDFDRDTLRELWENFPRNDGRGQWRAPWVIADAFTRHLEVVLTNPDDVDRVRWCDRCDGPEEDDYTYPVQGDSTVCEGCSDYYSSCEDCCELTQDTRETLHGTYVCESCRDCSYFYCDDCDGYYSQNDGCGVDHDEGGAGCECESPAGLAFTIRNNGDGMLASDTRATVTLPAGVISDEGIGAISRLLRQAGWDLPRTEDGYYIPETDSLVRLSYNLSELGDQWQTKEGNYTKRLSKLAHKRYSLKLSPGLMSSVGTIAREHSTSVDHAVEVTRDLNLSASAFAHSESCWWQSYAYSRCALKSNGGFGLRTFKDGYVSGRAWVMPLRLTDSGTLVPTFDTVNADAFVTFNGYGDLSGYTGARILSHMTGLTYRKVTFGCDPMFVNSDAGYLLAPEELASQYTDGSLHLAVDTHADRYEQEQASARVLVNA